MILRSSNQGRRGAYAVEFAIVSQILFLFIFAHIMGGLAVFDYIQTVNLAREGARWASVHGGQYNMDVNAGKSPYTAPSTPLALTSSTDVYTNAIQPKIISLDQTKVNNTSPGWSAASPRTPSSRNGPTRSGRCIRPR